MIRHIVFFTARDQADLDRIREGLETLGQIPHARHFEVGRNMHADRLTGAEVDFVVYAEFDNEDDLAAYKADPIYSRAIELVKPLRDMRIAADIQSD
ncbi:Dabb family protein [Roseovarius sp. A21]|uniref:Dabb family protein n=1 Tax=Roseovarius bejariae TaxID=2576383 RepID=A0A844D0H8_9RHOB|nr:Dabb family protein [Roseovarius bejariae]MRU16826.1 Dabb family protein [Roseovarius bejariae]